MGVVTVNLSKKNLALMDGREEDPDVSTPAGARHWFELAGVPYPEDKEADLLHELPILLAETAKMDPKQRNEVLGYRMERYARPPLNVPARYRNVELLARGVPLRDVRQMQLNAAKNWKRNLDVVDEMVNPLTKIPFPEEDIDTYAPRRSIGSTIYDYTPVSKALPYTARTAIAGARSAISSAEDAVSSAGGDSGANLLKRLGRLDIKPPIVAEALRRGMSDATGKRVSYADLGVMYADLLSPIATPVVNVFPPWDQSNTYLPTMAGVIKRQYQQIDPSNIARLIKSGASNILQKHKDIIWPPTKAAQAQPPVIPTQSGDE